MIWHLTRRDFLKRTTALAAVTPLLQACATGRTSLIRFGMVTDAHYADRDVRGTRYFRESLEKVAECVARMNAENVDFLVELGDLKDEDPVPNEARTLQFLQAIEAKLAAFEGPRYHVLGNHDMDSISKAQFLALAPNTGIPPDRSYYSFDRHGLHFVVLDTNFTADGTPYNKGNFDWRDTNMPPQQLRWLADDLASTTAPTLVFTHQLLDGEGDLYVNNAAAVRDVLAGAEKVLAVFQGHFHEGQHHEIDGIHYYTLRAVVDGSGPAENSYAITEVFSDGSIEIMGYRKAVSGTFF